MKFTTEIKAIGSDGELHTYNGPIIDSISFNLAQQWCENNGLGYCHVTGILVATIPVVDDVTRWDRYKDEEENNTN